MPSESTRQLQNLLAELCDKRNALSESARRTDYAQHLVLLIGMTSKQLEMSKRMDEAKSYARCY